MGDQAGANLCQQLRRVLIVGTGAIPPLIVQWSRIRSAISVPLGNEQARSICKELPELLADDNHAANVRRSLEAPEVMLSLAGNPWTLEEDEVLLYDGRLYIPPSLRTSLIQRHHDNLLAGHFGLEKTLNLLKQYYYWPDPSKAAKDNSTNPSPLGMQASVENYVQSCAICRRSKAPRHKPHGLPPSRDWCHD